jgi:hypothetical protein
VKAKTWAVWTVILLPIVVILVGVVGTQARTIRLERQFSEDRNRGVPSDINVAAAQMVSVWAGQPAVVIKVERQPHDLWLATAMVGPTCYEVWVGPHGDQVSAHPGLVPCPAVSIAGSGDDKLEASDERYALVSLFLDAWLRGDPTAGRFLADDTADMHLPAELASDVKVMAVYGAAVSPVEGARSTVTALADVELPGRTEALAWTFRLVRGSTRWSIEDAAGGEVPTGDPAGLRLGRTVPTTIPTFEQGD